MIGEEMSERTNSEMDNRLQASRLRKVDCIYHLLYLQALSLSDLKMILFIRTYKTILYDSNNFSLYTICLSSLHSKILSEYLLWKKDKNGQNAPLSLNEQNSSREGKEGFTSPDPAIIYVNS